MSRHFSRLRRGAVAVFVAFGISASRADESNSPADPPFEAWSATPDSAPGVNVSGEHGPSTVSVNTRGKSAAVAKWLKLPGRSFSLTGRVKADDTITSTQLIIQAFDDTWKQVDWVVISPGKDASWKSFAQDVTLPSSARAAAVYFVVEGNGLASLERLHVESGANAADPPAPPVTTVPTAVEATDPFTSREIPIGAGGYATGFAALPGQPVLYLRTDVSGLFRRDFAASRWVPLTDAFTLEDAPLYCVESVAVAPGDGATVYAAAGGRWSEVSDVIKSTDGGATWTKTKLTRADGGRVIMDGNTDYKHAGERLAVDPRRPDVVYFGSRSDGLFVTNDAASTWRAVDSFPARGRDAVGVTFVVFDPTSDPIDGKTGRLFAGVMDAGVMGSTDGGQTWRESGCPEKHPLRGAVGGDGVVWVAGESGLWTLAGGAWRDAGPVHGKQFGAVTVDPTDPKRVVAHAEKSVYVSADGGANWAEYSQARANISPMTRKQPWQAWPAGKGFAADTADLCFDPVNPRQLWLGAFGGQYRCEDVSAAALDWSNEFAGTEQMTIATLLCPTRGPTLISGVHDIDGFRHDPLDALPRQLLGGGNGSGTSSPTDLEDTTSLDFCEADPSQLVRVGGWKWRVWQTGFGDAGGGNVSSDGGLTWQAFEGKPAGAMFGSVAMSATDAQNIVWLSKGKSQLPQVTRDGGKTWTPSRGAPDANVYNGFWQSYTSPVASDRVAGGTFYLDDNKTGHFFTSTDGGAVWKRGGVLPAQPGNHWDRNLTVAAPGRAGEVWVAVDEKGLFRSTDFGQSFGRFDGISKAWAVGFGKGASPDQPTVYLVGRIDAASTRVALYRSTDAGKTWGKLNDDAHGLGNVSWVAGDRQQVDRVFVATSGRGIFSFSQK